ncbi:MAG: CoA transferase [Dehalococcoidia bacterium]
MTRFATPQLRYDNQRELYPIVAEWTRRRTAGRNGAPQRCGVPSGSLFDSLDLFEHPHLVACGAVTELDHPEKGVLQFLSPPFHMSASDVPLARAPLLGEHTAAVLAEELGIDAADLERLARSGVTAPAPASVAADD